MTNSSQQSGISDLPPREVGINNCSKNREQGRIPSVISTQVENWPSETLCSFRVSNACVCPKRASAGESRCTVSGITKAAPRQETKGGSKFVFSATPWICPRERGRAVGDNLVLDCHPCMEALSYSLAHSSYSLRLPTQLFICPGVFLQAQWLY